MANAPQGAGGGSAEGGHTFGFNSPPPAPDVTNRDTGITNVVQTIDVTKVCNDMPGDNDYDDPYPATSSKGMDPVLGG